MAVKNSSSDQTPPVQGLKSPQPPNQALQNQIAASTGNTGEKGKGNKNTAIQPAPPKESPKNNTIFTALMEAVNSIKRIFTALMEEVNSIKNALVGPNSIKDALIGPTNSIKAVLAGTATSIKEALDGTNKTNAEIKNSLEEISNKLSTITNNTSGSQTAISDDDVKKFLAGFEQSTILKGLRSGISSLNENFSTYSASFTTYSSSILEQPSNKEVIAALKELENSIPSVITDETSKLSDNFNNHIKSNLEQFAGNIPEFPNLEKFMENSEAAWSSVVDSLTQKFSESIKDLNQQKTPGSDGNNQADDSNGKILRFPKGYLRQFFTKIRYVFW
jgi:hypothetical protein